MTKTRIIAAIAAAGIAVSAFAAPAALAQAQQSRLTIAQVDERLSAQGFRVFEIEWDDGHYEVTATNAQGQCRELDVNPTTGAVTRDRADDDCHDDRRHGGDRR